MEYAQTVFDGKRHEGICRKVLFGEPGAVCSCRSPFPIPAPRYIVEPSGRDWAVVDTCHVANRLPRIYETYTPRKSADKCAERLNLVSLIGASNA